MACQSIPRYYFIISKRKFTQHIAKSKGFHPIIFISANNKLPLRNYKKQQKTSHNKRLYYGKDYRTYQCTFYPLPSRW